MRKNCDLPATRACLSTSFLNTRRHELGLLDHGYCANGLLTEYGLVTGMGTTDERFLPSHLLQETLANQSGDDASWAWPWFAGRLVLGIVGYVAELGGLPMH